MMKKSQRQIGKALVPCGYEHYNEEGKKCKQCDESVKMCMKEYNEYWKDLVETDGKPDRKKICRELFGYQKMLENVSEVYCYITNGRWSKPMYDPKAIIAEHDDLHWDKECVQDDVANIIFDDDMSDKEKLEQLVDYFEIEKKKND